MFESTIIDIIFSSSLLLSVAYSLVVAAITTLKIHKMRRPIQEQQVFKGISILKPLKGIDDNIEQNLRSYLEQDYPDYEIIFGVSDSYDPVIDVVNELITQYPEKEVRLVVDENQDGLNPKINNLQNILSYAEKEFILISDSNTRVEPGFLSSIIAETDDPQTGLVLSVLRGVDAKNWIASMENFHLNTYVTPNVFSVKSLFNRTIAIGKSMLISRKLLTKIGGFTVFSNYLAEDFMIARTVEKLGYKVTISHSFIDTVNQMWSFKQFLNRHSRWAKMRKNISVKDYLFETLSNPVAIATVYFLLDMSSQSFKMAIATVIFKLIYDFYISRLLDVKGKFYHYLLTPVKDILTGTFWYIPFFSKKINWRGNLFYIGKETILTKYWRTT